MLIKRELACAQFTANDGCRIRELLHPKNDDIAAGFSLAVAEVAVGGRTYRHRLQQLEAYFILAGVGNACVGGECEPVSRGDVVVIPAGDEQWIENTGTETLKFAAIVAPPWRAEDDERLD
jgi:mannose-6-phosphate isomerase-like protein (cupin superfamily)